MPFNTRHKTEKKKLKNSFVKKIFINPLIPRGATSQRDALVERLEWLGYGVESHCKA